MDLSVGDVVRVKEGVVLRIGREIVSVSADEVLLVAAVREYSVRVKSFKRGIDFWVGKSFVEVGRRFVEAPRKSLGKVNFNPAGIREGQVVKVQKHKLEDAQKWATDNGYHIELNADERFTVKGKRTKTVFIKSKDRNWSMYLPKRFLGEATDECAALDAWQLKALIDVALDAGDKEWFNELHSKLSTLT